MRKLIIVVALFLLLATPALALDSDSVTATINVSGIWYIDCSGDLTFTIDNGEYAQGWVSPDNDDYTDVNIMSNKDYNLRINRSDPDGWPAPWVLYANEGALATSSHYPVTVSGANDYWIAGPQPPTNGTDYDFYFIIDPIAYVDDWVGNHYMDITFTLQ